MPDSPEPRRPGSLRGEQLDVVARGELVVARGKRRQAIGARERRQVGRAFPVERLDHAPPAACIFASRPARLIRRPPAAMLERRRQDPRTVAGAANAAPASAASAGSTNSLNDTNVLTGLPGRPKTSVRRPSALAHAEPQRLAGLHAHLVEDFARRPARGSMPGTRSFTPADTPPETKSTSHSRPRPIFARRSARRRARRPGRSPRRPRPRAPPAASARWSCESAPGRRLVRRRPARRPSRSTPTVRPRVSRDFRAARSPPAGRRRAARAACPRRARPRPSRNAAPRLSTQLPGVVRVALTGLRIVASSICSQSSHFTTASAPAGSGAPVMTRIVVPALDGAASARRRRSPSR